MSRAQNSVPESLVQFLCRASSYPGGAGEVEVHETHMSWVFLTADRAYKLKKPVLLPYLDFSTLSRREAACRAELQINRNLAADIYLDVVPLTSSKEGYAIGGDGKIVDWLVVMRRLDDNWMLDRQILDGRLTRAALDRLVTKLVEFYHKAKPVFRRADTCQASWRHAIAYNHATLLDRRFELAILPLSRVFRVQNQFVDERGELFGTRFLGHGLIEGHGDLRPEHIWMNQPILIIDSLEFNTRLRQVDPFDEIANLTVECEMLGAVWASRYIQREIICALRIGYSEQLFAFYRCYRACLRARLAMAHLLDPNIRTPKKWRPIGLFYINLAMTEAMKIEFFLKTQGGRPLRGRGAYA